MSGRPTIEIVRAMARRLTPAEQVLLGRQLVRGVRRAVALDELPDAVMAAVSGGANEVSEIVTAVTRARPGATRKQVYNALGYLKRRGELERVTYGFYRPHPTAPTTEQEEG